MISFTTFSLLIIVAYTWFAVGAVVVGFFSIKDLFSIMKEKTAQRSDNKVKSGKKLYEM